METYAAKIEDGVVVQVIVGNAEWAFNALGGVWVDSDMLIGKGWLWDGASFVEPPEESTDEPYLDGDLKPNP